MRPCRSSRAPISEASRTASAKTCLWLTPTCHSRTRILCYLLSHAVLDLHSSRRPGRDSSLPPSLSSLQLCTVFRNTICERVDNCVYLTWKRRHHCTHCSVR